MPLKPVAAPGNVASLIARRRLLRQDEARVEENMTKERHFLASLRVEMAKLDALIQNWIGSGEIPEEDGR